MIRQFIIILFIVIQSVALYSQQRYKTTPLTDKIATLEVMTNSGWGSYPIIRLGSDEYVSIEFDYLSEEVFNRLRYKVTHCDASWRKSDRISEIEYLNGFNHSLIEDYELSNNTTVDYTHYKLEIPNKDVSFKVSGNYLVEVYDEDNPDKILLNACFSVNEALASIGYKLSTVTNIDANKEHQQLSITVNNSLDIRNPIDELKVVVLQNNRLDTERSNLKPFLVTPQKVTYDQNLDLIFEAGNEYRRFETSSYRSNGYRVASLKYNPPYYEMYINDERIRSNSTYSYDQDQNGRFLIRSADTDYTETEADYFMTIFTLPMEKELPYPIFINGDFTYNTFSDRYKMKYDPLNKEYRLSLLLKQGLYNYQYLVYSDKGQFTTSVIEGNYYEAENEYVAYAYYCPIGQYYDRLIATQIFQSRAK